MAHWRFDDREGSIAIDSASPGKYVKNIDTDQFYPDYGKYPGKIAGAQWAEGQINGGLRFDGYSAVTVASIPIPAAFSISAWVKPAGTLEGLTRIAETSYSTGLLLGTDASGTGYKLIVNGGTGSSGTCGQLYGCIESGKVVANAWSLITGTFDGGTGRLYINGVLAASDTAAPGSGAAMPLVIGASYAYGYGWRGGIDDVRVYPRALTPAEVAALFNEAAGARLPPVVIEAMRCRESSFLGRNTRTLTCALKSQNAAYRGTIQLRLDHGNPSQPAFYYGWPVNMVKDGAYAVTGLGLYDDATGGPRKVLGADFYGTGAAAIWEDHSEPRPVLVGPLDAPCPQNVPCASGLYPPPLVVSDFRCEIADVDSGVRSVTCGIAANQSVYGGTVRVTFDDNTTDDQRVTVEQPTVSNQLMYWGVVAVAVTTQKPITNVQFLAESPIGNWTPETTTPYPPPAGKKTGSLWCRWFGWGCPGSRRGTQVITLAALPAADVIPEPLGPGHTGATRKYTVGNPVTGPLAEYLFTDAEVNAILTQFQDYAVKARRTVYPK